MSGVEKSDRQTVDGQRRRDIGSYITIAVAAWLIVGLLFEAMLAARQWCHLANSAHGPGDAGTAERRRYGQWRAIFVWLGRLERVARLVIWIPCGLLVALQSRFDTLGVAGGVLILGLFALGDQLLRQPLAWARWRALDRRFGMSRLGAAELRQDALREIAVQAGLAVAAAVWLLWPFVVASSALAWPVSASLAVIGAAIVYWARPNVIAPLFNRFEPLPAGELRTRLEAMMQRCGTRLDAVLIMDHSRRSKLANAYFTGFGRSKRIVLFDTLIERLEAVELEAVMAHELGHYRCGHLRRYYGLLGGLLWLTFLLIGWVVEAVHGLSSPAAVIAAIYLLLPALGWPLTPVLALLRRRYEYEADAFAARHASRLALMSALEKLLAHNRTSASMDPWYAGFYATHPSGDRRLAQLAVD